jgi:peroxisomal 2,4-dienoyl-CoA reductase
MSDGIDWRQAKSGEADTKHSIFHANVLEGKVALVTGGGSGIGLEIATQFGLHGAKVAIMGRTEAKLLDAVKALNLSGVQDVLVVVGDVRDLNSANNAVKKVVERFGHLSILVNNAAGNFLCLTEDLSLGAFKSVVDIDLVRHCVCVCVCVCRLLGFLWLIKS